MNYGYDSSHLREQERKALLEQAEKARNQFANAAALQEANTSLAQALNNYVEFINHAVDEAASILSGVQNYYEAAQTWKKGKSSSIRLPRPDGALEEFYYHKAQTENTSLPPAEAKLLNEKAQAVWHALEKLDEQYKALEVYIRLEEYKGDKLQQGDKLLAGLQTQLVLFRKSCHSLYEQVGTSYHKTSIYHESSPYEQAARAMLAVLIQEQKVLDAWSYNLAEEVPTGWPLETFQQSVAADNPYLTTFKQAPAAIAYPASSMYTGFGSAISSLQQVKRQAIDDYTYQAKQSDKHGNEVYKSLLNYYNNDLLVNYNQFVFYARQQGQYLIAAPKYCPSFEIRTQAKQASHARAPQPFRDIPTPAIQLGKEKAPVPAATATILNEYIEFINKSLWAMHHLQVEIRNYGSTAEYYKGRQGVQNQSAITYSHEEFKIPLSAYQQVLQSSSALPAGGKAALTTQLEVLLNMLKEMDGLSVELTEYTAGKEYATDQFRRSDEITNRYAVLFELFDIKKEQLYTDVRKVFENYPPMDAASPWYISGKALLQTLDYDREGLSGVKAYMAGKSGKVPAPDKLTISSRELVAKEYTNMKGLKRIGRSNGNCPYTPYEDLAENSRLFAEKITSLAQPSAYTKTNKYEDYIYFYNNQLVYNYNKFCELAQVPLLKAVMQPHFFINQTVAGSGIPAKPVAKTPGASEPSLPVQQNNPVAQTTVPPVQKELTHTRDTVYIEKTIEKTRVDTVYISTSSGEGTANSMEGYAYNNMVLLLDVSGSMNSPHKLPLLKKSVKNLLQMLRPEDEVAIVVYSGNAHVLLEPTPGNQIEKISQAIDKLKSDGGTDGNAGLKLAYKVADKNYKRGGNNRIILATDGEFPISSQVYDIVEKGAREDIYLTVFSYSPKESVTGALQRLSERGKGHFEHITPQNSDSHLVREAKAKRAR
jgi:uncharacterized protein YegL